MTICRIRFGGVKSRVAEYGFGEECAADDGIGQQDETCPHGLNMSFSKLSKRRQESELEKPAVQAPIQQQGQTDNNVAMLNSPYARSEVPICSIKGSVGNFISREFFQGNKPDSSISAAQDTAATAPAQRIKEAAYKNK